MRIMKKLVICIVVLGLLIAGFLNESFARSDSIELNSIYPVSYDSLKWDDYESTEEMLNAVQVSEEILQKLSTEDLLSLALKHPLAPNIFAYNSVKQGIEALAKRDAVFKTLYARENVTDVVLQKAEQFQLEKEKTFGVATSSTEYSQVLEQMLMKAFVLKAYECVK